MQKSRFLCHHHRRWLSDNPTALPGTWQQSYSRRLDLAEDCS